MTLKGFSQLLSWFLKQRILVFVTQHNLPIPRLSSGVVCVPCDCSQTLFWFRHKKNFSDTRTFPNINFLSPSPVSLDLETCQFQSTKILWNLIQPADCFQLSYQSRTLEYRHNSDKKFVSMNNPFKYLWWFWVKFWRIPFQSITIVHIHSLGLLISPI